MSSIREMLSKKGTVPTTNQTINTSEKADKAPLMDASQNRNVLENVALIGLNRELIGDKKITDGIFLSLKRSDKEYELTIKPKGAKTGVSVKARGYNRTYLAVTPVFNQKFGGKYELEPQYVNLLGLTKDSQKNSPELKSLRDNIINTFINSFTPEEVERGIEPEKLFTQNQLKVLSELRKNLATTQHFILSLTKIKDEDNKEVYYLTLSSAATTLKNVENVDDHPCCRPDIFDLTGEGEAKEE